MSESQLEGRSSTTTKVFARESTGLVREVSALNAIVLGASSVALGQFFIFGVPFAFGLFAARDSSVFYWAILICTVFTAATQFNYATLTTAMPRSGGDYVFVTRLVNPALGFAGNFTLAVWQVFAAGAFAVLTVGAVVSPLLSILGSLTDSATLDDWASTVTSRGWTLTIAIGMILVVTVLLSLGTQLALRVNTILWMTGMFSLLLMLFIFLFTSRSEFMAKYDAFAGETGSYDRAIQAAVDAGFTERDSLLMLWPVVAIVMGVYGVMFWYTYLGGEIRGARSFRREMWMAMIPLLVIAVPLTLLIFVILRTIGYEFLSSVAYLSFVDPEALPGPAAAGPIAFVTGLSAGNDFLATLFIITFAAWVFVLLVALLIMPIRCALAWSLDQLFPRSLTVVSRRFHTPVRLSVLIAAIAIAVAIWATYSERVFQLFATAVLASLFFSAGMGALAAAFFPWRMRELYEQLPAARYKVLGVPLLAITGVASLLFTAAYLGSYGWFSAEFGITLGLTASVFSPFLIGFVIYFGARAYRRSQGIPMELAFRQLPPE
jgi:amino acid transporter